MPWTFTDTWEWIGFFLAVIGFPIGVVAFLMAVQPFVKMIWGRPKIFIAFDDKVLNGVKVLQCSFMNVPITRGILNRLRIRRDTAEGLFALFDIKNAATGEEVFSALAYIYSQEGEATQRIDLPASWMPARIAIMMIAEDGTVHPAYLPHSKEADEKALGTGLYNVHVTVEVAESKTEARAAIVIQSEEPYAYWVNSS